MASELGSSAVSGVASEAAKQATKSVYEFVQRHTYYIVKFQSQLDKLKNQVNDLENVRERVVHQVAEARRRGEEIEKDVELWLKSVNEFTEGIVEPITGGEDKAKKRCFIGLCPNVTQRYILGKKAAKALPGATDLSGKGNFGTVSYCPPLQRTVSIYVRGYEAFDSRMSVLLEITEALKDANVNMIGVYGMGGVGKTTLVKKAAWQAKEDKLFDEVVMTTVTQAPDFKKIQEEIADQLGLKFPEESVSGRSHRLRDRLKREKRILVILDDIWSKLDLDAVGIPLGGDDREMGQEDDERRYKILLTSRDQDLLRNHMNIEKNFLVDLLSDEEAWYLFHKIVGDSAENSNFRPIAVEVVGNCAGLPIAIETVAMALKNKSLPVWEHALAQLTRSNPRHIEGMTENVCSIIELSYNFLKSEEKSLFLLCGLINAGGGINITDLLKYSMGLRLFQDVYTMEDGRNRLHVLIHNLKALSLLLDGITKKFVKMHDIIHAVATSIAASDEFMFNIKNFGDLKEVLEEKVPKSSTAISFPYRDIGDELPESFEYPKLKLFYLSMQNHSLQIPDLFFQEMKELKVLDLTGIRPLSLPSSLRCLKNLQTLCLDRCLLGDIAIVGELKKLVILSLLRSDIEKLPREIGQLTRLKMLDLSNCSKLKVIAPNVISSLSQLEELYVSNSFIHWETEGLIKNQERSNASLLELKQMSCLTTLEIHVHDLQIIPQDLFSEKLKRYRILIGDVWDWSWHATYGETSRMLKIKLDKSISLIHRVKILLKKAEELHLELNGGKNAFDELDEDGFAQLKHLHVQNGHELLYIANSVHSKMVFPELESLFLYNLSKLKKICCGLVDAKSFSKLRIIKVEKCGRLRYLFSSSMARNISQIQEIEVTNCKKLKEIFGEESEDHVDENERNCKIEFKQLHSLVLQCLPQLISFGLKVVLLRVENLKLSSINIENIWVDLLQPMFSYIQCLKSLIVEECNGLKFLFSSSMVKSLVQLQKLVICNCKSMEAVILDSEELEGKDKIIHSSFPKLFYLKLEGLSNLTRFGIGNSIQFHALKELHIESCSNMKTFFPNSSSVDALRKESEEVSIENILITDINPLFDKKVAFPSLEKMILSRLEKVKSLFPVSIATCLLQLKELTIFSCGLEEIVAKEHGDEVPRFLFSELCWLKLDDLPELKHFYLGSHTTEWPMLKKLMVYKCEKIKVYALDGENQPALFSFEKVIPKLETLGLNANNITYVCLDRILARSFGKLECLVLVNIDNVSVAFWFGILKKLYHLKILLLDNGTFEKQFPFEGCKWKEDSQVDIFLQNLQTLKVWRCHLLRSLIPSSAISFKNLKNLELFCCNGLANVLACSAVRNFVHLTTMRIRECKLVTEVIATEVETMEEEIVFSRLKILELHCLKSLTCFSSTNYAFKFPCLEKVIVSQCANLKIFSQGGLSTPKLYQVQLTKKTNAEYFWKDDLNSTIQQMFTNMIGFRNFEHLKLSEFFTLKEKIWNGKVPIDLFCNLKSLVLDEFPDSTTAIPYSVLTNFKNLETLEVKSCDSLKELFDMEGQLNDVHEHTWNKSDQEIFGFKSLRSLKVDNCNSLRHIFTMPQILGLVQLQEIEIKNCALIEEIITKKGENDANTDKIKTFRLKSIILKSLPNLKSFYSGSNILESPPLETIIIKDCQNIYTWDFSLHLATLFNEKVVFPTMDDLTLPLIISEWIWHKQLPAIAYCFQNCAILVIDGFDHLKYLFPSSMVKNLFQLKELEISNCKFMEGVIIEDEGRTGTLLFPKFFRLWIDNCPFMKSFISNSICGDMASTKEPEEMNSNENLHTHMQPLFDKKVRLPNLKRLKISHMDELEKVWDHHVSLDSFPKLNCLVVEFCNKLANVFPSNMLVMHQQLEVLEVKNCDSVEEIFKVLDKSSGMVEEIVFSELTELNLHMLPSLKSFYLGSHISEWPVLKELNVYGCTKVEILASEFMSFQLTHGESQPVIKIQQPLFLVDEDAFPRLKELELCELPRLLHLWRGNSQPRNAFQNLKILKVSECGSLDNSWSFSVSFQNLMSLQVSNCDGLRYLLTLSKAKTLERLTSINISNCKTMVQIITHFEGQVVEDSIAFNKLDNLEIHCLPSLTSFCCGDITLELPSLKKVIIKKCLKMETFSHGVLSTPSLQTLQCIEGEYEVQCKEGNLDLNSAIQQLFKKRV